MRNFIVLAFLASLSSLAFAEEPFEDYGFVCKVSAESPNSIEVEGYVDPSGSFAMSVRAKGTFKDWNGAFFMARRYAGKKQTTYRNITKDFPKTSVRIYWGDENTVSPFKGYILSPDLNSGKKIEFTCEVQ